MHFLAKGFTLLLSISAHAALALAAAHGAPRKPALVEALNQPLLDFAELEFVAPEPLPSLAASVDAPAPLHHHHPYPVPEGHDAIAHDPSLQHVPAASPQHSLSVASSALSATTHDAPGAINDVPSTTHDVPSTNHDAAVPSEPSSAAPRFSIDLGAASRAAGSAAPTTSSGRSQGPAGASDDAPLSEAAVDQRATLLVGHSPSYTAEAAAAGVEANLPLEIVVDASGTVVSARALAHLGYGLDEAAVRAVRSYRFSPARLAAKPHSVRMRWAMRFQLR